MIISNLPDNFTQPGGAALPELNLFNYEVSTNRNKNKINMTKHVLSFLTEGEKQVHFSDSSVSITANETLLISSGNFLMTEHIGTHYFRCLLFFFSQEIVDQFFMKYPEVISTNRDITLQHEPYFPISRDEFVTHFVHSLKDIFNMQCSFSQEVLRLKFEEIILYLIYKYKEPFVRYLKSLLTDDRELSFKAIVENNLDTNLNLEEIAFLCSMSLSSFKRKFVQLYQVSPGKWFQRVRLNRARKVLKANKLKPSEIYMDYGYESLSNFSIAFKKEFGYSPKELSSF